MGCILCFLSVFALASVPCALDPQAMSLHWDMDWPTWGKGWAMHDLERELYETWDLPYSEEQIVSYNSSK